MADINSGDSLSAIPPEFGKNRRAVTVSSVPILEKTVKPLASKPPLKA